MFTGSSQKKAAEQQRTYLAANQATNNNLIDTGLNASTGNITGAATNARGALTDAYGNATGAVNTAATDAAGNLNTGANNALGYLGQAGSSYDSLSGLGDKYGGATTMALNALGVNGQAGTNAAQSAFTAGPAYNWNLDQGLEAINRSQNARGMLNSGNTDRDAQLYGAGLASNQFNTWMNNLLGFTNPELSATSGAASGYANAYGKSADVANSLGLNLANNDTNRGTMLANLASTYGTNLANNYTGEGTSLSNLNTNAANSKVSNNNSTASQYSQTYKNEADAATAASSNLWGAGLKLAGLASGGLGSLGTTATGASSLGSLFSSSGSNPFNLDGTRNTTAYGY